MPSLQIGKYLFDIQQACDSLLQFTQDKSFADYSADPLLRSAVERQFEIAGEALNQLLRLDPAYASRISHARRIIAFRNRHALWFLFSVVGGSMAFLWSHKFRMSPLEHPTLFGAGQPSLCG